MLIYTLQQQAYAPSSSAPVVLTLEECRRLTPDARRARSRDVKRWLKAQYISSERDEQVLDDLEDLIDENLESPSGTTDPAIITGDYAMGKSKFIERAARTWHRRAVGEDCDPCTIPTWRPPQGGQAHYAPVVLMSLEGVTTAPAFRRSLLETLDHSQSAKASPARLFFDHGTRILVVDDVHFLVKTPKKGVSVLQELKYICTALGQLGGTVVLVGAGLEDHPMMEDPQVTGRSQPPFQFTRYKIDDESGMKSWIGLLKATEALIAPYLPAGHPGMLYREATGLTHQCSRGQMRDLMRLVRYATAAAIEDGAFEITPRHLAAVSLSERSRQESQLEQGPGRHPRARTPRVTREPASA